MAEIFEKVEFHQGNPKTEKFLGDKNVPISTVEIIEYLQQCYVEVVLNYILVGCPLNKMFWK